jgi:hypothetical protein
LEVVANSLRQTSRKRQFIYSRCVRENQDEALQTAEPFQETSAKHRLFKLKKYTLRRKKKIPAQQQAVFVSGNWNLAACAAAYPYSSVQFYLRAGLPGRNSL